MFFHFGVDYLMELSTYFIIVSNARKHPNPKKVPKDYTLGEGHINFFKDKLKYLKERHELIKKEMRKRGFQTNKTLDISNIDEKEKFAKTNFPRKLQTSPKGILKIPLKNTKSQNYSNFPKQLKNWKPKDIHLKIIKKRLIEKINKKPDWYRYYRKKINEKEMIGRIKEAGLN